MLDLPIRTNNKDVFIHVQVFAVAAPYVEPDRASWQCTQEGVNHRPWLCVSVQEAVCEGGCTYLVARRIEVGSDRFVDRVDVGVLVRKSFGVVGIALLGWQILSHVQSFHQTAAGRASY